MPSDTYEMDRPRHERMAGASKLDSGRARRIGQMQANPEPTIRAYARRLLFYMNPDDREASARAYREIPESVRAEFEAWDRSHRRIDEFGPLDAGEALYMLARERAETGKAGAMLDIREGSPYALSEYLRRWREKRGEKPAPLAPGEHDRLHAKIIGTIRREAGR